MTNSQETNLITLTGYEVIKELGRGGMATVYLAKHEMLDRDVALKILSFGASDTTFRNSFISEARVIAKLEHSHIVKIYDIGIDNDQFYMAMEYIQQGTLKEHLKQAPLSIDEIINVIEQIAQALSYAHKQGYIHRDIKPANILYRTNNDLVLADFGIAKLQGTDSDLTQMGYMSGTPSYMSPEQAMGEAVDARTDIYSLGVVLYEMLIGEKPYQGNNTVAITYKHAHEAIPKVTGRYAYLQQIIDKALAKNKEERYDDVLTFSSDLKDTVHQQESDKTVVVSLDSVNSENDTVISKNKHENLVEVTTPEGGEASINAEIRAQGHPYTKNKKKLTYLLVIPLVIIAILGLYFKFQPDIKEPVVNKKTVAQKKVTTVEVTENRPSSKPVNLDNKYQKIENLYKEYLSVCDAHTEYLGFNRVSASIDHGTTNYAQLAADSKQKAKKHLGVLCKKIDSMKLISNTDNQLTINKIFSNNDVKKIVRIKFNRVIHDCISNRVKNDRKYFNRICHKK